MKKTKLSVCGMHCKSCELLLEKSIGKLDGINKVVADENKGTIDIEYRGDVLNIKAIEDIVKECGYTFGTKGNLPWLQKDSSVYLDIIIAIFIVLSLYLLISILGVDLSSFGNTRNPTLSVVFLIGLTAGISSCMALVGGLVLAVSSKWSEDHASYSKYRKFEPHIFFNIGRVLGFGIFGGILGLFGSVFALSPFVLGAMIVVTGVIMLLLGINLTEISPKLSSFTLTLPKSFGSSVGEKSGTSKHIFALGTGALTFFLPCGFTLAMQAYAISTGSFTSGALIMMFFALGTVPGLLGIGGLSSLFSGNFAKKFFKFSGVVIIILSLFNISNGYNLVHIGGQSKIQVVGDTSNLPTQEIRMTQSIEGYAPSEIHIKPNSKIKWIITGTNPFSCSSQIMIPSLGITKTLEKGENTIEFVSPASGEIKFSCSMGMYNGKLVIDPSSGDSSYDSSKETLAQGSKATSANQAGGCKMTGNSTGGCSMNSSGNGNSGVGCSTAGANSTGNAAQKNIADKATVAGSEEIKAEYTTSGMNPQEFNLVSGKTYKLTIDVKDTIEGCMSQILIPGFDDNAQDLIAGNKVVFTIKADEKGKFPLTCAMGVPHGYLNIN